MFSTKPLHLRIPARLTGAAVAALVILLGGASARGQGTPTFTYAAPPESPGPGAVQWKAQAKGGVVAASGNSQSGAANFGAAASRKQGANKLTLDGNIAYGRSTIWTPVIDTSVIPNVVVGLDGRGTTTTNNWNARGRYDRFFTPNNTGFIAALGAGDKIAGKTFFGGGQIGYGRQLVNSAMHLLIAELGYDFSYERYVDQPGKTLDSVSIHSARVFVGEALKLSAFTGISASVEALFNLNKESGAYKVDTQQTGVDPFHDTRLTGKVGLTTTLVKSLSFGFGFTVRYDQNPAPRPLPTTTPAGIGYKSTFFPFADKVDTLTDASLIYTFL
ncbi:MAG TPA: DUF481 domain-containing protein [Polyangia bacterium]|nr:DUF481 domain-containing protein [Polyangia bacterium]